MAQVSKQLQPFAYGSLPEILGKCVSFERRLKHLNCRQEGTCARTEACGLCRLILHFSWLSRCFLAQLPSQACISHSYMPSGCNI